MAAPPPPLFLLAAAAAILAALTTTSATIHPDDLTVLSDLHRALTNPELLPWPKATDPCGTPGWVHVSCDRTGRVNNLDLKNAGLAGTLPPSFPLLSSLQDLSIQNNNLSGPLPSFRGMANLRRAYLNGNAFDALPDDFFDGLRDLEEICLDDNPDLNKSSGGWAVPPGLATSTPQLRSLRLMNCSLVYEHMSNGALSKHLFQWKQLELEPLSWKKRLNIALDVARGMEYLHTLAQQCYIHRDLKSANILLGDDFRAKVSDFGLLKSAPDGNFSVATRLAGTFGYLAPEYAVTGKITTKADVFSFGVVLMELITGMTAIDERRIDEETRYLASWFCQIRKDEDKFRAAIDPSLVLTDEIFESISVIAELAGHCTSREPSQRPDMGHAVTVLVPMVEKWKPSNNEAEDYMGIDLHLPLLQMVKGWQESEASMTDGSILSLEDSKGSIPARPAGFAESFTSADGR